MTATSKTAIREALAANRAFQAALAKLTDEEKRIMAEYLDLAEESPVVAPKRRGRKPGSKSKAAEVPQTA